MQKKILILILALVVIAGGAWTIFHKSNKPAASSSTSASTSANQSSAATSGPVIQTKSASNVGSYLADANGDALYTYGGDSSGVSNCNGSCIYSWPFYGPIGTPPSTLPANVTVISRSDGTKQYAYKGLPLYSFTGDPMGQVTGDNVSNFHVAKP